MAVIVMLVAIVHTISWLPRYFLWEPLANWRMHGCKTWDEAEAKRFSQTATSLMFFCSSTFFVSRILSPKDWLYSRQGWQQTGPLIDPDFRFYYLLYSARFLSEIVSIFFEERKRVRSVTELCELCASLCCNCILTYPRAPILIILGCVYCILHSSHCHGWFGTWIGKFWTDWLWRNHHVLF